MNELTTVVPPTKWARPGSFDVRSVGGIVLAGYK